MLRRLILGVLGVAALVAALAVVARFSDGPIGPFPGGKLSGVRVTEPVSAPSTGSAPARSRAAPTPWTQRAAIRNARLPASEQAIDAAKKTSSPAPRIPFAGMRRMNTISPNAATATAAL